jgi:hypothetical protein
VRSRRVARIERRGSGPGWLELRGSAAGGGWPIARFADAG